jgi:large subunit ribosomal protein L31e
MNESVDEAEENAKLEEKVEEKSDEVEEPSEVTEESAEETVAEEEKPEELAQTSEEEAPKEAEKEEAEEEIEIVEERIYTVPLQRALVRPRKKRTPRAVRMLKAFMQRHMKPGGVEASEDGEGKLVISNEVNEKIWRRGIEKPPRKIRVRAVKDVEGTVTVYLAEGD